jgi:hypothetical protein
VRRRVARPVHPLSRIPASDLRSLRSNLCARLGGDDFRDDQIQQIDDRKDDVVRVKKNRADANAALAIV